MSLVSSILSIIGLCIFCSCLFFLVQDNDLSEFDESREIIESLVDEYKACESPDYIKWGMEVITKFNCILSFWV